MNTPKRTVVVPVDFSEQSLIALGQAFSLSKYFNTRVTILHVRETGLDRWFGKTVEDADKVEEKLKELVKEHEHREVETDFVVDEGLVHEKIIKLALSVDASFIIMGVTSGFPSNKKLMGDTALKVVRESRTPVITIKGKEHRIGCSNIVLPLDLTEETTQKVANAIEFAKLGACAIRILSVLFSSDDFTVSRLVRQMEEVRNVIESYNIECTAELVKAIKGEETTAEVIMDYAERVEGDLVMIMTQQETETEENAIGSTAEEIIMDSEIPVLSIIPQKKAARNN
jgi:nucleotide-binding universal stress UspA family protein